MRLVLASLALAAGLALPVTLAAPAGAQSLSVLLPVLSFPDPVIAPSTKGCSPMTSAPVCELAE
jgi:hypothetical protein